MNNTSVIMLAASEAAGHPFKHEESARQWFESQVSKENQEFHLKRARAKVYLRSSTQHSKLISQAVWDKAFARA